jgi:formamidopyrimidine-DNA glycosylase
VFELPECLVLAAQMDATIRGKKVARVRTKNVEHKFVWHNRAETEFSALAEGGRVGKATVRGRWICLDLDPGYVLVFGECGGILRFEVPGSAPPAKYHFLLDFEDGSFLWARTAMWGAYELHEAGRELERQYIRDQRPGPLDPSFNKLYFDNLIAVLAAEGRRSAKSLLTQDQLVPGLGNAIAQDILFAARIAPKRDVGSLGVAERDALRTSIVAKVREIEAAGGRSDETDLFGRPGGYARIMDKAATKRPCPRCGGTVAEGQYLGGAIYWCPGCQA